MLEIHEIDPEGSYLMLMEELTEGYPIRVSQLKREFEKRMGTFDLDFFYKVMFERRSGSWLSRVEGEVWYVKNRKQRQMVSDDIQVVQRLLAAMDQNPEGLPVEELQRRLERYSWGSVSNVAEQLGIYVDPETGLARTGIGLPRKGRIFRDALEVTLELIHHGAVTDMSEIGYYLTLEGYPKVASSICQQILDIQVKGQDLSWRRLDLELYANELTGWRYNNGD